MTKATLLFIGTLLLAVVLTAIICLEHTRSDGFDFVALAFYAWVLAPSAGLWLASLYVYRKNLPQPWGLTMSFASLAFAVLHSAMLIQISFFPGSSTDAIGFLLAPVLAAIAALWTGGIVQIIWLLRRS